MVTSVGIYAVKPRYFGHLGSVKRSYGKNVTKWIGLGASGYSLLEICLCLRD
jgi:hypothetical protein